MTNSSTSTASTNNWDTAFAINFKNANTAISAGWAQPGSTAPPNFSQDYTDGFSGQKYAIGASFAPWQLVGGSGSLVHLELPLQVGTVTPDGSPTPSAKFSGSAVIEVRLSYLNGGTPGGGGQQQKLRVRLDSPAPSTEPVVTVQTPTLDNPQMVAPVQSALQSWLNDHLEAFNHVFAVVDVNTRADKEQFQWLKPTKVGYAVVAPEGASVDDHIFGVLAMTEGRQGENLADQISPNIIPAGNNAGFLISRERFLSKILLPGMSTIFNGASATDFELDDDDTLIRNTSVLTFQDFVLEDGTVITDAKVDKGKFTVELRATTLAMNFAVLYFTWKGGYIVHLDYAAESTLSMDANKHFQTSIVNKPTLNVVVTKTEAEKWAEIITGLIEGIAFAVAGAMIGAALGPAVDAAGEGLSQAGTDAAEGITDGDSALNFTQDFPADDEITNLEDVDSDSDSSAADDLEAENDSSYKSKFKGWFRRNWRKVLGMAIGGAVGAVVGKLPDILEAYAEKNLEDMPTLDEFADNSVSPTTWPNSTGYTLESIALNESLQFGLNVQSKS